jgi:predicted small lipoprotein YifL
MKNFNRFAVTSVAALSLLTLAACGSKPAVEVAVPPVATDAMKAGSSKMAAGAASGAALLGVVKETKTAVAAGDFSKAGQAFEKFEGSWKLIQGPLKTASPKAHDAIEMGMGTIKTALKAKDGAAAKTALTSLETSLAVVK